MNIHAEHFIDTLNEFAKKSSRAKIFDDFLQCAAAVLNRDEVAFARVENKSVHVELFGKLMAAMEDSIGQKILRDNSLGLEMKIPFDDSRKPKYRDVLGEIFSALELHDQNAGQVFTPQHVADIMGESALTPELVERELKTQGCVSIKENCCGSGALILGALNALLKLGVNPCRFARVHASDLDRRCILMTFIQLSLYAIPAVVVGQDAITGELHGAPLVTPILRSIHHERISFSETQSS